ncbi:hypothetical protein CMV_029505 [Castanea mollissima]|uniref:WHEP-TRS domain-containing protein n=1 Tax=Castanea mollissima TaxID=60419 RepID=A0A8J4Q7L1_9ROSI|nr:hypothetical protein CMV_029505 [Castanea mollissima]
MRKKAKKSKDKGLVATWNDTKNDSSNEYVDVCSHVMVFAASTDKVIVDSASDSDDSFDDEVSKKMTLQEAYDKPCIEFIKSEKTSHLCRKEFNEEKTEKAELLVKLNEITRTVWVVSTNNSPSEICLVRYRQLLDSMHPNQIASHKQTLTHYAIGNPKYKQITAVFKAVERLCRIIAQLPLEDTNGANPKVEFLEIIIFAVAGIRNPLAYAIHTFFQKHGFLYVHTPIITTSDCEGAGEMFKVTTMTSEADKMEKELIKNPPPSAANIEAAEFLVKEKGEVVVQLKSDKARKEDILASVAELKIANKNLAKLEERSKLKPVVSIRLGRLLELKCENTHTLRHLAVWMVEPEIAFAELKISYTEVVNF